MDEFKKAREAATKFTRADKDGDIHKRKKFLGYTESEIADAQEKRKPKRRRKGRGKR